MRPDGVVMPAPALDDDLRLAKSVEDLAVEQLVPEPGIEALDVAILPRAARSDVGGLGSNRRDPLLDGLGDELGVRPSSRTGGEPTIDQGAGPCRSKAMARHRIHSLAFKKQVVQEYAAGATLNALAREHDLSRTLIRIWIAKCESGEFDPDVEAATLLGDYEAKIATLERMVGRQAVEIEFLKGALQQGRSPRSAPMLQ